MKWFPPLAFAWILCAGPIAFGQTKTERVLAHLGEVRYEQDKPVGTVKFVFQQAILTRVGTGRLSYRQLLTNQRGYSNSDNAGDLLAIQVVRDGKSIVIYPEPKSTRGKTARSAPQPQSYAQLVEPATGRRSKRGNAESARAVPAQIVNESPSEISNASQPLGPPDPRQNPDPVRPRPLFDEPTDGQAAQDNSGGGLSIPDSSTIARNLDQAKEKVTGYRGKIWQNAQPIWEFVMWIFNSIIVFLICLGGLFRYVAKTAAAETKVNRKGRVVIGGWIAGAHHNASGLLLIITWVIAIFFLIDAFMWLIYLNLPLWLLVVIWFPLLWLAERLTGWIVPNLRGDDMG
jgi:hypothetical protein